MAKLFMSEEEKGTIIQEEHQLKMHSVKKENARWQNFLCLKRRKVQIL